jgi:hypothetical protein
MKTGVHHDCCSLTYLTLHAVTCAGWSQILAHTEAHKQLVHVREFTLPPHSNITTAVHLLPYIHKCRLVTVPGTHNSNAIKNKEFIAESQQLGFKEQLAAGVRLFDLDFAGGVFFWFHRGCHRIPPTGSSAFQGRGI